MKYMMFVCTDTEPDTDKAAEPDIEVWVSDNDARGRRLEGSALAPTSAATTVRVRDGRLLVSDGPFTETKEVIGGFAIFEFATREEAIAAAERFMELHRQHWPEWEGVCEMRPMFGFQSSGAAAQETAKVGETA